MIFAGALNRGAMPSRSHVHRERRSDRRLRRTGTRSTASAPAATTATTTAVTATPAAIVGSATPIGTPVAGAANSARFASVGRIFLDGNGAIFAAADSLSPVLQVGAYTANTDCTISVTITDSFATPASAALTPVQASVSFEGVLVQTGAEIDLVQTGTGGGAVLTLRKAKQFTGCTTDGFAGTFGLAAGGVATAAPVGTDAPVTTSSICSRDS